MVTYNAPFKNSCPSIHSDVFDLCYRAGRVMIDRSGNATRIIKDVEEVKTIHLSDNFIVLHCAKVKDDECVNNFYFFDRYETQERRPTIFEPEEGVAEIINYISIKQNSDGGLTFAEDTFWRFDEIDEVFDLIKVIVEKFKGGL